MRTSFAWYSNCLGSTSLQPRFDLASASLRPSLDLPWTSLCKKTKAFFAVLASFAWYSCSLGSTSRQPRFDFASALRRFPRSALDQPVQKNGSILYCFCMIRLVFKQPRFDLAATSLRPRFGLDATFPRSSFERPSVLFFSAQGSPTLTYKRKGIA